MDEAIKFIKELGFPIAVTAYLLWRDHHVVAHLRDAVVELVALLRRTNGAG